MKIAIITLVGNFNYGNRLQNLALQTILHDKLDAEVDNLTFYNRDFYEETKNSRPVLARFIRKIIHFRRSIARKKQIKIKNKIFTDFKERNFNFVDVNSENADTIRNSYDFFVIGSDQVWNPIFTGKDNAMFAMFVPAEKVISYAASFGISRIPDQFVEYTRSGLKNISKISVREQDGITIVKNLIGAEAELVLDPTMLLTRSEWSEAASNALLDFSISKPYVVVYVLGIMDKTKKNAIRDFANHHNFEIHTIMGDFFDKSAVVPDPLGFIKLIEHAQFVFTDSFHATVFSILMNTPFKVFSRDNGEMNSRILTLLENVKLPRELLYENDLNKIYTDMRLDGIDRQLTEQRVQSIGFLKRALQ